MYVHVCKNFQIAKYLSKIAQIYDAGRRFVFNDFEYIYIVATCRQYVYMYIAV